LNTLYNVNLQPIKTYHTMEKRIAKKVDDYICEFKQEIKSLILSFNIHELNGGKQLLQSVLDKPNISFTQEDFIKRQRAKNIVNLQDRCTAKRASGELCSRKRKKDTPFCGTHCKGIPYGCISDIDDPSFTHSPLSFSHASSSTSSSPFSKKIDIYTIDIQGIIYYIDDKRNAYLMEDIMKNIPNPQTIGFVTENNTFVSSQSATILDVPVSQSQLIV